MPYINSLLEYQFSTKIASTSFRIILLSLGYFVGANLHNLCLIMIFFRHNIFNISKLIKSTHCIINSLYSLNFLGRFGVERLRELYQKKGHEQANINPLGPPSLNK